MGLIRVILALSVVAAHTDYQYSFFGTRFVDSNTAVEAFFIISGFYMSIILTEKYVGMKGAFSLFITNRFLRLFPLYWLVLIITLIVCTAHHSIGGNAFQLQSYYDYGPNCSVLTLLFFVITNIIILGQDLILFLGFDPGNGHLFFVKAINPVYPQPWNFMLVPQAWTVGLELIFYMLAPLLVRMKSAWIWCIMGTSLACRLVLNHFGFDHDPWTFRFFPNEVVFFLSGIMAYRFYRYLRQKNISKNVLLSSLLFLIFFSLVYKFVKFESIKHLHFDCTKWVYCTIMAFAIPFIFLLTKKNKLDREVGELSYAIYIVHFILLQFLPHLLEKFNTPHFLVMPLIFLVVIGTSFIMLKIVVDPLEKYRQRRVARAI